MEAIRAFIAIELPEELRRQLSAIGQQIQEQAGEPARRAVRWVPAANMHLTLKFLGEVSSANLRVLARMLEAESARFAPFTFTVGELGAFPNTRRPRVLWIGSEAPPALGHLQHAIDQETKRLGYPGEDRPYSPHLTLGRVNQNAHPEAVAQLARVLGTMKVGALGTVTVDAVHLFQSELRPAGSVYTSLARFPLKGAGSG